MLKTLFAQGQCAPLIVCDECGGPICDAGQALAICRVSSESDGELLETYHVHEGRCSRVFKSELGPDALTIATGLRLYFRQLLHNAEASRPEPGVLQGRMVEVAVKYRKRASRRPASRVRSGAHVA
jgi:hypothetical protein